MSMQQERSKKKGSGSPGRTRTSDPAVNSRLLYQLSYRGTWQANQSLQTAHAIANARGSFQTKKCKNFRNGIPAYFRTAGSKCLRLYKHSLEPCPPSAAIRTGASFEAARNKTRQQPISSAAFAHRSAGDWHNVDPGGHARIFARAGVLDDPARVFHPFG